jgi:hypothetical protein
MTRGGNFKIVFKSILPRQSLFFLMGGILALGMGTRSLAGPLPRLTYTKVLKGSFPEYMSVSVDADGKGTYDGRKLDDPPNPCPLQISRATTERLFSLAEALGYFRSLQLESRHKVADMGLKTLTYEAGGQVSRVVYNYSENRTAEELSQLFDKISMVEEHIKQLDFAMKYDPLSLAQELREIQIEMNEKDLAEAELLAPTLEKIASNPRLLHLAQSRAQEILKRIQESN